MRKNIAFIFVCILFTTWAISDSTTVSAKSMSEIEDELKKLDEKYNDLKSKQGKVETNKQNTESKIGENLHKQTTVEEEIKTIDEKLNHTKSDIKEKEAEITKTNNEIDTLNKEIKSLEEEVEELERRIEQREELLKDRLLSIQENGGEMKYMDVLLGSQTFSDFISRSTAVNTIMDQDKTIMEEHTADKLALEQKKKETEEKKKEVENKKAELEQQKNKLDALKDQLDSQVSEKEKLMDELVKQYEELEEYKLTLEEEQQILAGEAAAIEKAKQLANSEKEKLEQQAREEAARKAAAEKAAAEKSAAEKSANNYNSNNSGSANTSTPAVSNSGSSGSFGWPASGRFSSGFGPRVHPITKQVGKMHNGIDIAAPTGTPVSAAASGVVSTAGWMGGYGNTITVTHHINGKTYTTLYAHLSSISVKTGQTVSRGQVIGAVGSTGNSTGPHLHFEIHEGGFGSPRNPLNYLP